MTEPRQEAWTDAALALTLLALDPTALGGIVLRGGPDPRRETLLAWLRELRPDTPQPRIPLHITDDRLLGGIALAATLARGEVVFERGVLPRADGGLVVVPMAERLETRVTTALAEALDRGELRVEREGLGTTARCRIGVVALDEGIDDERIPAALADRLAFVIDIAALGRVTPPSPAPLPATGSASLAEPQLTALCQAAVTLGIDSLRAPLLAARAACAHAALHGRAQASDDDVATAARLVLGPRATRLPAPEPEDSPPEDDPPPDDEPPPPDEQGDDEGDAVPLEDLLLDAAESGIPAGVLDDLLLGRTRPRGGSGGRVGSRRAGTTGGRPAGTRMGAPRDGERLAIVDTLRAAAPWQRVRRRAATAKRVEVRRDDFRVRRYQEKTETTVIFAVDASGSAALRRLAEAKGAVEQVLVDCYARRDQVALIAFRRAEATVVLPPTRSLARARRRLAGMVGGGTTPLAAGIDAAIALTHEALRQGRTPIVVIMTDGRGNVARDGTPDPGRAAQDAEESARALAAMGASVLFLDTAPRPRPRARRLADAMGAKYMPLPYVDARGISAQVQTLAKAPAP